MIELKEINKTYKSKKGTPTEALKNINLKLGDKGVTFILGKSGSGKSTLLNILGGLDTPTSGELIIGGKSSKDFKESDYDAYRNTYMGFIFQEYNLIDAYNIEDNIKLSLELQGEKVPDEEIKKVLKKVGLEGFEKRKTNELSGGQRQRVAIARAIIKKPKVVLADEPTGNLDSETSKQIFELLKEISKESLVIIVSHDNESANAYGDRTIKIVDGAVKEDTKPIKKGTSESIEFKKSKLPARYSYKMGVGNLLHKKVRVFFTFIALVVCFVSLGITTSLMNYDIADEVVNQLEQNGGTEVRIVKYKKEVSWAKTINNTLKNMTEVGEDLFPVPTYVEESFVEDVNSKTGLEWIPNYSINTGNSISLNTKDSDRNIFYSLTDNILLSDSSYVKNDNLIGRVPTNKNEIVIPSYLADVIMKLGVMSKDKLIGYTEEYVYRPTSYEQIINDKNYILIDELGYFKITGIIKFDTSKYEEFKNLTIEEIDDMVATNKDYERVLGLNNSFQYENNYRRIYVHKELLDEYRSKKNTFITSSLYSYYEYNDVTGMFYAPNTLLGYLDKEEVVYTDSSTTDSSLNMYQIIINETMLDDITEGKYREKLEIYLENNTGKTNKDYISIYLKNNDILVSPFVSSIHDNSDFIAESNYKKFEIKGVILDNNEKAIAYVNKEHINQFVKPYLTVDYVFRMVDNPKEIKEITKIYPVDGSNILSETMYSSDLVILMIATSIVKGIGKYITIVFAVVAVLMLVSFIGTSIKFRKKEIGILRALGCKGIDLTTMFIYECLTLVCIAIIASCLFIPGTANGLNEIVRTLSFVSYDIVRFGFVSIIHITILSVLITVVVSILPMIKVTRQKPIDTILDK